MIVINNVQDREAFVFSYKECMITFQDIDDKSRTQKNIILYNENVYILEINM